MAANTQWAIETAPGCRCVCLPTNPEPPLSPKRRLETIGRAPDGNAALVMEYLTGNALVD
jgi:hypothetical protein